ncbi:MAG: peptidyl-prolyl cis-trans isomerase [Chitinophagaceae bacterium]
MSIRLLSLFATSLLFLAGCQQGAAPADVDVDANSPVVARYAGHQITVADVDARVLGMPRKQRPTPATDLDAWFPDLIKDMVIEDQLSAYARDHKLDQGDDFIRARNGAVSRWIARQCVRTTHPEATKVSDEDLHAEYDTRKDQWARPERRLAYHIFLRRDPGTKAQDLVDQAEKLRQRVLGGESFSLLASQYSQSETRHQDGLLGWVGRGMLPEGFEKILFALDEGVPSKPIATREGVQLFYVDHIVSARKTEFDEVKSLLRKQLVNDRMDQALAEIEQQAQLPTDTLAVQRDELLAALRDGSPEQPLVGIGARRWTLGDFQRHWQALIASQEGPEQKQLVAERPWPAYEAWRRMLVAQWQCESTGVVSEKAIERKTQVWEHAAMISSARKHAMQELAEEDEARLRLFYNNNIGQFSSAPQWKLRHLSIPLSDHAAADMARLEAAAADVAADLDKLATELGGQVDEWEPATLGELARRDSRLPTLVSPLTLGQLSAPYRTDSALEQVQAVERIDSAPQPFDEVREQVAERYLAQYTADIFHQLSDQLLTKAHFELVPEGLEALRAAGLPKPEISVEQLDAALDEIHQDTDAQ